MAETPQARKPWALQRPLCILTHLRPSKASQNTGPFWSAARISPTAPDLPIFPLDRPGTFWLALLTARTMPKWELRSIQITMEAETPCVEYVYQRLVQLVARAFYKLEMKALFKEDEPPEITPPAKGKASKKLPVSWPIFSQFWMMMVEICFTLEDISLLIPLLLCQANALPKKWSGDSQRLSTVTWDRTVFAKIIISPFLQIVIANFS